MVKKVISSENVAEVEEELVLRPTCAEIDLNAIAYNLKGIRKQVSPAEIMAVVKADAYGHGVIPVAKIALECGAEYLGVALVEEGIELREHGFDCPILVFGGAISEQSQQFIEYDLDVTVYTEEIVEQLNKLAQKANKKVNVHVKIDTGMGRVGVLAERALPFIESIAQKNSIYLKGIFTHFANSDEQDKSYARLQFQKFQSVLKKLEQKNISIDIKHTANSGAILDMPETYLDMVRPGVMMYGYYPSKETTESVPIKPAMTFKSVVIYIKQVPANTSVSYGLQYTTKKTTRIATIPVGYADGYNRLLTNKGMVTIRGKQFPVVGRVCMDLILVDLGEEHAVQVNDEVVLFGKNSDNAFTVEEICQLLNTIPYEVTCWVSKRVPRYYVKK